ncbi:MAG: carbohydrate ABC transporter permease [Devosia sp.]|uniref:carbohydrate ABC transporter permease n=1 Tax=Devosia sp. TaxID=1871048 RepID=UPI001ACD0D8E|nr:carbohydrate ABC transporter permease [Devosia sp.]MBN9315325.1 carbohydrate ABC transporter permease [Devosia sp.]
MISATPAMPRRSPLRTRARILTATRAGAALIVSLLFFAPIYWMILTALKSGNEAFKATPSLIVWPDFENFALVFTQSNFGLALSTSLFVSVTSTVLCLVLGASIAYPLARVKMRGQKHIAFWILSLRIIPPIAVIIPLFLLLRSVGLTGSIWSLVIVYTYMNLPLTVWLLRGFFADLPTEIEEASFVDGAGRLRTFIGITLPLTAPGLIATALLCFIFAWNEFLFANILTGAATRTAPVGLTEYVTPVSVEWNKIMAAGTLVVLPVWIGALAAQRYLVRGLTLGAVK